MLASSLWQSTSSFIKVYTRSNINQCNICLEYSQNSICQDCLHALPRLGTHCPQCAEPNYHGHICGECLKSKPAFDRVISPYLFEGPVASMLQSFKRSSKVKGLNLLTHTLIHELESLDFDVIIPIPYHWRKLLRRGHNPSGILARQVSSRLSIPLIHPLKRSKVTLSQQALNKEQRKQNVRNAFMLKPKFKASVKNKRILLLDDVLTTGATANAAAKVLKRYGAKSVVVACIARTPISHLNKPR